MTCIDKLLDDKNRELYRFVSSRMTVSFEISPYSVYGVHTQGDTVVFYIPDNNLSTASFAHELLHVKLHVLNIYMPASMMLQLATICECNFSISQGLSSHIGNVLEHEKFFSDFIAMGYHEREFISDYDSAPMSDDKIEIYQKRLKKKVLWEYKYDLSILDSFIGQYFSLKSWHNSSFNSAYYISKMSDIEPELCAIIDDLFKRWMALDIYNDKLFDEGSGELYDTYGDIAFSFVESLKGWIKNKKF